MQAAEAMDINQGSAQGTTAPTFTRDVLRIEKSGPLEEHLTLIDLPGIFENESPGVTTRSDIILVKDMVKSYIKNPRTLSVTASYRLAYLLVPGYHESLLTTMWP